MARLVLPPRSLVMVGGVPGSGKSHLLGRVRLTPQTFIVSADGVRGKVQERRGFDPNAYIEECIEEAREEFFNELHEAFSAGESILVEAAYLSTHSREEMIWWCNARAYTPHLILVTATFEQCLEGNRNRPREVPFDKMVSYWHQFKRLEDKLRGGKLDKGLASATVISRTESYQEIVFADA